MPSDFKNMIYYNIYIFSVINEKTLERARVFLIALLCMTPDGSLKLLVFM